MRCTVEVDNPLALAMPRDHGFNPDILYGARGAAARLVPQPLQPVNEETPAPFTDRDRVDVEPRRNDLVDNPVTRQQNDPGTQRQSLGRLAPSRERPEFSTLALVQDQRFKRTTHRNLRRSKNTRDYEPNL
jgi:hypothetical protein